MADNLNIFKVYCEGGLNTNRDVLSLGELKPGSARKLINYEPSITGGYRRISGYENAYPDLPGAGKVLGVCVANGINDGIFACRGPEPEPDGDLLAGEDYFYRWDETAEDWVAITLAGSPDMDGVNKIRFVKYNFSSSKILLLDGVNPVATYDGTTYTQITSSGAPSNAKYGSEFQSHIFLAGESTNPNLLYFSAPLDPTDYTAANGAGVINVGFPIVQIKVFRDELYVFGTNAIKKVVGNNIADFSLQEVTQDLGCLATDSVFELGGDLFFLAPDGLRPISATDKINDVNIETVSKDVQSVFNDILINRDLDGLNFVLVRQKSQFRYFFDASDAQGLIGGLRQTRSGQMNLEFGQSLGISASCADSGYIGKDEFVIHGDSAGKVYRQERGNSFDGDEIFSVYETPFYHMEDPELRKNFLKLSTYLKSEGDANLVISIVYDYETNDVFNPGNYNLDSIGAAAFYNQALFDSTAIYDGNPSPVLKTNFSGSGYSISIRYVTQDTNASHSVQGLVLTFGVGDRR